MEVFEGHFSWILSILQQNHGFVVFWFFFHTFKKDIALLQYFNLSISFRINTFNSASIFILFFVFSLNADFIYEYPAVGHQG